MCGKDAVSRPFETERLKKQMKGKDWLDVEVESSQTGRKEGLLVSCAPSVCGDSERRSENKSRDID